MTELGRWRFRSPTAALAINVAGLLVGVSRGSACESTLIDAAGIGPARLGMRLGALKANLAGGNRVLPRRAFLVDVDVDAVPIAGGDGVVQFVVLMPAGSRVDDAVVIRALLISNLAFRTREGVGPGASSNGYPSMSKGCDYVV